MCLCPIDGSCAVRVRAKALSGSVSSLRTSDRDSLNDRGRFAPFGPGTDLVLHPLLRQPATPAYAVTQPDLDHDHLDRCRDGKG